MDHKQQKPVVSIDDADVVVDDDDDDGAAQTADAAPPGTQQKVGSPVSASALAPTKAAAVDTARVDPIVGVHLSGPDDRLAQHWIEDINGKFVFRGAGNQTQPLRPSELAAIERPLKPSELEEAIFRAGLASAVDSALLGAPPIRLDDLNDTAFEFDI